MNSPKELMLAKNLRNISIFQVVAENPGQISEAIPNKEYGIEYSSL